MAEKAKIICPPPQRGGHNKSLQNKMTDCDKINEYDHCNSTISSVTILLLLSIFLLDVDRLGSIK